MQPTLAVFLLFAAPLAGQGLSCRRVETPAMLIRAEGMAELLPDILLSCTGGTPVAAGAALPRFEILAISNMPLGNRIVPAPKPPEGLVLELPPAPTLLWNDALLLIDDPSPAQQSACVPADGTESCAATAAVSPNVFQGKQLQSNVTVFRQIPLNPPGAGRSRLIRITNLRADVSKQPIKPIPQVQLAVQIFDSRGDNVPLEFDERADGEARVPFKFEVRTSADAPVATSEPALTVTPSLIPQNNPGVSTGINLKFTETFASAFRRRNLGTSGNGPTFVVDQANPGLGPGTESGFFNSAFSIRNNLNAAGLADSGTRLKVVITDIPDNVQVWVSGRDVSPGTSNYTERAPRALLTYADDNGGGPFAQNFPAVAGYALVFPIEGKVTAVWEVVAADPAQIEELSFSIRILAPNGVAHLGLAMAQGSIGPVFTGVPLPGHDPSTPQIPSIPSFAPTVAEPVPAIRIVPALSQAPLTAVSAASYLGDTVAPDSVVAAFAPNLAPTTEVAGLTPARTLAGVTVDVIDFTGTSRPASLFIVSPGQINFLLEGTTKPGPAVVNVSRGGQNVAVGYLRVEAVAPGLFSAQGDGRGFAAGDVIYTDGANSSSRPLARFDGTAWVPEPVVVDGASRAYLVFRGTGIRGRTSLAGVKLTVGGESVPVEMADPLDGSPGVDQLRVGPLPRTLARKGDVPVVLTVDNRAANELRVRIQ